MAAQSSKIEWTESTWNPVRGCTRVSEGCRFCYAERIAARFSGAGMAYEGLAENTKAGARWTQKVQTVPALFFVFPCGVISMSMKPLLCRGKYHWQDTKNARISAPRSSRRRFLMHP